MKNNKNCCPNCGTHLSPLYMKQECKKCGANLLYYKMDERLEQDAKKAQAEVDKVNAFVDVIKNSTIKTPWHIVRLVTFFLPLATMCLPMYWAGHKNVSLISFIMSIINHGFDLGAIMADKSYMFAVLSMVLVIVLSLVEIINSLFSATKNGYKRNSIFSSINTLVLGVMGVLVATNAGVIKVGYYATLGIYALVLILHDITADKKDKIMRTISFVVIILCALPSVFCFSSDKPKYEFCGTNDNDLRVVTFNVASAFGTKIEDNDSMDRCNRFADYMNANKPSLIGTQEMNSIWLDELKTTMPEYESYGVKRGGDSEEKNSEMNAVFWNKSQFTMVETNTFWLSQTPDEESKYTYIDDEGNEAEAGCNRICSYAVLVDNSTKNTVVFMNTHLDNSSENARTFGVNVILQKLGDIKAKYSDATVIVTGDFNESESGEAYKILAQKLTDTTLEKISGATYQEWGYRQTGDEAIDFVFTSAKPMGNMYLDDLSMGYVSDHYGILAEINY